LSKHALFTVKATAGIAFAAASTAAHGKKLDSGLGDLPHDAKWQDKSGRNPVGPYGQHADRGRQGQLVASRR
jgi:hypothetical protein